MRGDVKDVVISVLGIEGTMRGDELDFSCPSHSDRHPSAGVNLTTGAWHCFVCGAGGDLASLVMAVRGVGREAALGLVKPESPSALQATVQRTVGTLLGTLWNGSSAVLDLPWYEPTTNVPYLLGRGLTRRILKAYGVSYVERDDLVKPDGKVISIRDYAAIPVRDQGGALLAWCYRACHDEANLRYLYTPGIKRKDLWFGSQVVNGERHVVVTEGPLDAMWVHQCGLPSLALMSATSLSPFKMGELVRFDSVTLFLDRDSAGVHAALEIGEMISHRVPTRIARYPRGFRAKDPMELPPEMVKRAVDAAVQFDSWRIQKIKPSGR